MKQAIGLLEFRKITCGIAAADSMCKAASIELLTAQAICPGKYLVMVTGDVGAVKSAVAAGTSSNTSKELVASFVIPNLHESVIAAIKRQNQPEALQALGVIECASVASAIVAADASAKSAPIQLLEVRLARFMGGKAVVSLTGEVSAVQIAVEAGCRSIADKVIDHLVLPAPHKKLGTLVF
ncbi:MAG: BMC domain-containing protein [Sporomusaceae bacterium]|nr:BMC domain-containing protein [Sporomusaceae bacterium]